MTVVIRMKSLVDRFILPVDDLPEGIFMLTLTGSENLPLSERLFYIQDNEELKLNLETNKTEYDQRDSVSVKISIKNKSGYPEEAFLSLSAAENNSLKTYSQFPSTISSWFLLESDVKGAVEEPSYYFDPSNPDRLRDLDILLLTQGWRDFEWKYKDMNYPPETGFTISGRLKKLLADVPLKNAKVNIGVFSNGIPLISIVPADTSGRFYLHTADITGSANLVVSAINEKEHLQGRIFLDSILYSPAKVQDNISNIMLLMSDNQLIKDNTISLIRDAELKNTIRKKYKLSDTINLGEVKIIAERHEDSQSYFEKNRPVLYGKPDRELIITSKLLKYTDITYLIEGELPATRLMNPIILLDGIEVGFDGISLFPISWIERIDVYRRPIASSINPGAKDGIISIVTRTDDNLIPESPVYHSANIKFSGYSEPRIFYSPKHSSALEYDYNPDLRTTLFWEPNIKVDNGKDFFLNYFNSDNSAIIKIIVEGMTESGIPITGMAEYQVK